MLRLLSDEDVRGYLYGALMRAHPGIDLVRVQDVGLRTASDPVILGWAAAEGRIVLTQDHETMPGFAYDRVLRTLAMPGLFVIRNQPLSIGLVIQVIVMIDVCSTHDEWKDQVVYLPL
jgi:predicted nuclease of predicted toxin-antitoxin system